MNYFDALQAGVPSSEIAEKAGLSYVSAASALKLANRPKFTFVDFESLPYLAMLGGAMVAVDMDVIDETGAIDSQRMWLPVMDQDNKAMALSDIKITDVNNSRMRALVKAIACVTGFGMSVYLGTKGDGAKAATMIGVTPDSVLAEVTPIVATLKEGGAAYVEWGVAIAAARITDPSFKWTVVEYNGMPFREVLGGILVDIETCYRGVTTRLSHPVMDAAFNAIPADKVTTFDWNKTVMRALTKCLAFNCGYGLSVYSGEDLGFLAEPKRRRRATNQEAAAEPKPEVPQAVSSQTSSEASATQAKADTGAEAPVATAPADVAPVVSKPTQGEGPPEYQTRFKAVMDGSFAKEGLTGLVNLFEKLKVSTKFDESEKPHCKRLLTTNLANKVKTAPADFDMANLLNVMKEHEAMAVIPLDAREMVSARYVLAAVNAGVSSADPQAMTALMRKVVEAKVASSKEELLALIEFANGNIAPEVQELLNEVLNETFAS